MQSVDVCDWPILLIKSQAGALTPFGIIQGPCFLVTELKTATLRLSNSFSLLWEDEWVGGGSIIVCHVSFEIVSIPALLVTLSGVLLDCFLL